MPAQVTLNGWSPTDAMLADTGQLATAPLNAELERHARWRTVAGQRVYFGHQSVGNDILGGLQELSRRHALGLRVVESADPSAVDGAAVVHFAAGYNQDPFSKNDALLAMLASRHEADGAIALLKYCYVDMGPQSDIWRIFASYRRFVARVERDHPDVTLVHATMPLTANLESLSGRLRSFLDRSPDRDVAVARHHYNTLVREAFAGRSPLFDLAAVEATRDDGSRAGFLRHGEWIDVMAPEHSSDGGHLSARGARKAAAGLLDALAAAAAGGVR